VATTHWPGLGAERRVVAALVCAVLVAAHGCSHDGDSSPESAPSSTNALAPGAVRRVSVATDGIQGEGASGFSSAISGDGAIVAFSSEASNLVVGDGNGVGDVLVRDLKAGTTERVSVSSDGVEGNGLSFSPAISADGAVVVFYSDASNLVGNDLNGRGDVFAHDRRSGETEQVSVSSEGVGGNALSAATASAGVSADGRFVAFQSFAHNLVARDSNGTDDVFLRDRERATTALVSVGLDGPANGASFGPALSADGRWVTFASAASNLVEGDSNGAIDQFVYDVRERRTELVSMARDGGPSDGAVEPFSGSSISVNGRVVTFVSSATNLDEGDTNGLPDVYRHDRVTSTTVRISIANDGSQANGESGFPSLSADGDVVVFESVASNLVEDDRNALNDVFLHNPADGSTQRVGIMFDPVLDGRSEEGGNRADTFFQPSLSADGSHLVFYSEASSLVPHDDNGMADAFVVTLP
jgi:Tol biopolymer transport system component